MTDLRNEPTKQTRAFWPLRNSNLFGADSVRWQHRKLTSMSYSLPASKLPSAVVPISNCRVIPRANVSRRRLLSSSSSVLQGSILNGLQRQTRTYLSRTYKLLFLFIRLVRSHRGGYDLTPTSICMHIRIPASSSEYILIHILITPSPAKFMRSEVLVQLKQTNLVWPCVKAGRTLDRYLDFILALIQDV